MRILYINNAGSGWADYIDVPQSQAVEECKKLVAEESIHSIILCPGFTHKSVAEIVEAVGRNVVVSVARVDGPGSRLSAEIRRRELS